MEKRNVPIEFLSAQEAYPDGKSKGTNASIRIAEIVFVRAAVQDQHTTHVCVKAGDSVRDLWLIMNPGIATALLSAWEKQQVNSRDSRKDVTP